MIASPHAEDSRLLPVAAAIARGEPVDWASAPAGADAETTTVLDELRVLEGLSRAAHPIPDTWGPFTITGELGHGSYGTVYRAHDSSLGLEIALKVIRPHTPGDEASAARALREARLVAQVHHPHVVRIFRADRLGDEVGISMELLDGQTLHQLVRANGPFSAKETLLIGGELCQAVAAVHGARLLHGDIKANNVMRAQGGRTVLMDFGAGSDGKAMRGHRPLQTAGTPVYLAPEVRAGEPPSVASDIYSLGVLLFFLATGTYPVSADVLDAGESIFRPQPARRLLRDVRADLPESFNHVVERALAERPGDRYGTIGEFEAAIDGALRNDRRPMPVPPPTRWPLGLAAAAVVTLLGVSYQLWPQDTGRQDPRATTTPPAAPTLAPIEPAAASAYQVEAAFYRHQRGTDIRLQSGARVSPGDELSLRIESSVPVYVYVVNEDDRGASYLLFPLRDQQPSNPLPAGTRHEIPGVVKGERIRWKIDTAGGREHFLVFVTPDPPTPALDRVFAQLKRPSFDAPVVAEPLNNDLVGALRGVGGLVKAPPAAPGARLSTEFADPLPDAPEHASGVWVRQLTLENPVR
jgi:serine/threonine protein kinase